MEAHLSGVTSEVLSETIMVQPRDVRSKLGYSLRSAAQPARWDCLCDNYSKYVDIESQLLEMTYTPHRDVILPFHGIYIRESSYLAYVHTNRGLPTRYILYNPYRHHINPQSINLYLNIFRVLNSILFAGIQHLFCWFLRVWIF